MFPPLTLLMIAVWCFDYLLTLDREIEYFWCSSWSLNKALFFGYRYPPLLYILINIFAILPWPSWQNYHVSNHELFTTPSSLMYSEVRDASPSMIAERIYRRSCAIVLYLQMALSIVGIMSATRRSLRLHLVSMKSDMTPSRTVFAALRVFALFGRSRALFALVFVTGVFNPAVLIVSQSCNFVVADIQTWDVSSVHLHKIGTCTCKCNPRLFAIYSG